MAGRPSKPVQLIKTEKKSHRTKEELAYREQAEQALRTGQTFEEETATAEDPIAHEHFIRLKKLYKNIEFVEGLDQGVINTYCQLKSQEQMLHDYYLYLKERFEKRKQPGPKFEVYEDMKDVMMRQKQLRDEIVKLEDRLFLNPVARIKAIPKSPPEDEQKSPMAAFLERKRNAAR